MGGFDPQRHHGEPVLIEPRSSQVAAGSFRGAEYPVGPTGVVQPGFGKAPSPPGRPVGMMTPRKVVDGGHQRASRRRNGTPGGVHKVGAAGQPVDRRPAQAVPGLVEDAAGQGRVDDLDRGLEVPGRRGAVTSGEANQFDVGTVGQRPGQADGGYGGAAGYRVPALFEEVGGPDGVHWCPVSRIAAHRAGGRQSRAPAASVRPPRPGLAPGCVVGPRRELPLHGPAVQLPRTRR